MRGIIVLGIGGLQGTNFGGSFAGEDGKAGFPFPPDKAGQLLRQLLQPAARSTSENTPGQIRLAGFAAVERPEVPLAVFQGDPPQVKPASLSQGQGQGVPARPPMLPEAPPFAGKGADPIRPQDLKLPPGVRVRLPSVDVNQP